MDKTAIKKCAVWARRELISRVTQKALKYGISEEDFGDINAETVNGNLLTSSEKAQRKSLIGKIKKDGFEQAMEQAAYTWFNRFCALRFMEVNGYLPTHIRVFTDEQNNFNPQILTEAIHIELDGLDKEKVYTLKSNDKKEELYKYLLITQCNALGKVLPGMFTKIEDYTELLFPDNLLREGSVIEQMISMIREEDWADIEIIGWLYQYYISEKHEEVVDPLHGKTVEKDDVPAATQLFTTDWVVRYLIDNSVGRYWLERNPNSNLKNELEYFVTPKDGNIPFMNETVTPQDVTVLDPCVGSGHFLVYAFEVLMKIYKEYGYSERDAAKEIIENNLFGLDLDDRAVQLACFAVTMKARQYDRRFLTRECKPHIFCIAESEELNTDTLQKFGELSKKAVSVYGAFADAKEYGSILSSPVSYTDALALKQKFNEIKNDDTVYDIFEKADISEMLKILEPLINQTEILAKKYAVVATNPPYLNKFDAKLKKYINDNFADYKGDLFSVFMYRNFGFCKQNGYSAFMTPNVWMFIKTYENLRDYIINQKSIVSLIQMAKGAFFKEATVDICAFILKNANESEKGLYFRLEDFKGDMEVQKQKVLEAVADKNCGYFYETSEENFSKIPGSPIAYWVSEKFLKTFVNGKMLGELADSKQGIATADNNRFLREWFEVDINKTNFHAKNHEEAENSNEKWFPYNKGGEFRKWYGNNDFVVNWENNGFELKSFKKAVLRNPNYYFKECASWSLISSGVAAFRYKPNGHLFDVAGMSFFGNEKLLYLLALANTKYSTEVLKVIAPTINYQCGDIACIPVIEDRNKKGMVEDIVKSNIDISKNDWDFFETSWDFKKHPMI